MKTDLKRVITNKGIFYYHIELKRNFDSLYLYRKKIIKNRKFLFWQLKNKEKLIPFKNTEEMYDFFHISMKGDRIENIKDCINDAIHKIKDPEPIWDGIMTDNKQLVKDILMEEGIKRKQLDEI